MCGKFTQLVSWQQGLDLSLPLTASPEGAPTTFATPMRPAKIIRLGEDGRREQVNMRWGFSKHSVATPMPDHMHARAETVDSKPRFCDAFGERRGILLVNTFNEGEKLESSKTKQWVIRPKDRKPIPIAVIWEEWQGGGSTENCFVMVTVPPNELIATITDRMPAIVQQQDWPVWLGEVDAPFKEIRSLLRTFDDQGNWEMVEQDKLKAAKPSPPKPPAQLDLF